MPEDPDAGQEINLDDHINFNFGEAEPEEEAVEQ